MFDIWWEDPITLSWLSIILVIIGIILGLFFQSDSFPKIFKEKAIKIRIYYRTNKLIFFLLLFVFCGILLLSFEKYLLYLIFYSIMIPFFVFFVLKKKKELNYIISCDLGDIKSEKGENGLRYIPYLDGNATRIFVDGQYARSTNVAEKQGYIYFSIEEQVISKFRSYRGREIYIVVEYFDNNNYGNFNLHYDSLDKQNPLPSFKGAKSENFTGSNSWKIVTWKIDDANFRHSQQDLADFRFRAGRASSTSSISGAPEIFDVILRRVIVVSIIK